MGKANKPDKRRLFKRLATQTHRRARRHQRCEMLRQQTAKATERAYRAQA